MLDKWFRPPETTRRSILAGFQVVQALREHLVSPLLLRPKGAEEERGKPPARNPTKAICSKKSQIGKVLRPVMPTSH